MILFDLVAREVKSGFTSEKWPVVAELEIKMAEIAVVFIL